jgi:hypothetical protein
MPARKHHLSLTDEERAKLDIVARSHRHSARERTRAKILLLTDTLREGGPLKDAQIAEMAKCHLVTVGKIRDKAVERGVIASLEHKEQEKRKERRLDGAGEAALIALTCSEAPEGRKRWTMKLLKGKLIEMEVVETIDEATICRTLKKTRSNPG